MNREYSERLNRREFAAKAGYTGAAVLLLPAISSLLTGCATIAYVRQAHLVPKDAYDQVGSLVEVDLGKVPQLLSVGGSATIEDNNLAHRLLIVRATESRFIAVSCECTHRGRALGYEHEDGIFKCSSIGGSKFGLDGKVLSGPADANLKVFETEFTEGILKIRVLAT
jgi:Rieske Fe-S protein